MCLKPKKLAELEVRNFCGDFNARNCNFRLHLKVSPSFNHYKIYGCKAFLAWKFKCHNDNKWGKERKQSLRYFNFPFFSWQTSTWKSAKKLKRRLRFITAEEETDKIEMFPTCVTQKNETFRVEIAERRFGTKNNSRLEVGASRRRLATLHQGLPDYDDAGRRDVSWTKDSLPSSVERDDPNDGVTALRSSARVLIAKSPS